MKTVIVDRESPTASELVEQAQSGPILLRNEAGKTFVLAEVAEDDAEALALSGNHQLEAILERSRNRAARDGWLTTEQLRQQLGLPAKTTP